jgi:radical SAM protein with 4Fe4S-binding SPASM domain
MDQTLTGIKAAREGGLPFQVNSTITKHNISELNDIYNMAIDLGAENWDVFLLVPTGRGKALLDAELSAEEYEDALNWLYEKQKDSKIPIKLTCAPHYHRIRVEKGDEFRKFKACMGGETFGFVSHTGQVQICGFLDIPCGDARADGFANVWKESKVLKEIRDLDGYKGKCNGCSYLTICGGCRARAYGVTGDYLESEPFCTYEEK